MEDIQIYIAQFIGFISFGLGIYSFYQKDDKKLKIMMAAFQFTNVIHFFLLGSLISAVSTLISVIRTGLALRTSSAYVAGFFIFISLISGFYLVDELVDILPIIGAILGTIAVFLLKGIKMRLTFLLGSLCWLTNNIIIGSIGGTMLEATLFSVNLTTIYRIYRTEKYMKN